jgi:alpha-L-arabinofuranosidase
MNERCEPRLTRASRLRFGGAITGQVLTAAAMDSHNRFGGAEEVRAMPFRGARWAGGKLHVDMPAKSVVVLSLK